ncbi:MAG TPA: pentapeptide repeat-containing protein [Candidatus Brocadiia bacterium]|nr:pentapeptide repeat-containing protein [Candidatus Brocadiia bacterium]
MTHRTDDYIDWTSVYRHVINTQLQCGVGPVRKPSGSATFGKTLQLGTVNKAGLRQETCDLANLEHLAILHEGVEAWNNWRQESQEVPDLSHANLKGAQLEQVNFNNANLIRANLRRANLRRARFNRAQLERANLSWANLLESTMIQAGLEGANLSWACLVLANLSGSNIRMGILRGAGARLCNFTGADLTGADLRESSLEHCVMHACTLNSARLWRTDTYNWNVIAVTCNSAYWDEEAQEPVRYAQGQFEQSHRYWPEVRVRIPQRSSFFHLTIAEFLCRKNRPESAAQLQFSRLENKGDSVEIIFNLTGDSNGPDADEIRQRVDTVVKLAGEDTQLTRLIDGSCMKMHHTVRMMAGKPELLWDEAATPPPAPTQPMRPALSRREEAPGDPKEQPSS